MIPYHSFAQQVIESPKKQIEQGVLPKDVKCNIGLILIIAVEDGSPKCVTPSSAELLFERGWTTTKNFEVSGQNATTIQAKPNVSTNATTIQAKPNVSTNATTVSSNTSINMMIGVGGPNVQDQLQTLKPYLRDGDIIVAPPSVIDKVSVLQQEIPGLQIGTGGVNVQKILPTIATFPSNVNYVTYDYEKSSGPDFSKDQTTAIGYFDQLYQEAHKDGKKLVIVPVWLNGQDWDWGEVAKHTDILLVQVQNFQTGANFPPQLTSQGLGIDLGGVTKKIIDEVHAKSPSTKIYLQFGFKYGSSADDVIRDIKTVKNIGADGINLWFNPLDPSSSYLPLAVQVLQSVNR